MLPGGAWPQQCTAGEAARSAGWEAMKCCTALQDELHRADCRIGVRDRIFPLIWGSALPCASCAAAWDLAVHHWDGERAAPKRLRAVAADDNVWWQHAWTQTCSPLMRLPLMAA